MFFSHKFPKFHFEKTEEPGSKKKKKIKIGIYDNSKQVQVLACIICTRYESDKDAYEGESKKYFLDPTSSAEAVDPQSDIIPGTFSNGPNFAMNLLLVP